MLHKAFYLLLVGFLLTGATCSENSTKNDASDSTMEQPSGVTTDKSFKDLPDDEYSPPPAEEEEGSPAEESSSDDSDSEEG